MTLLAAGALAGPFSERMRAGHRRQGRLLASGLRLAHLETLDELPAVLIEELRETIDLSGVSVSLLGAPVAAVGTLDGETLLVPIRARGVDLGTLTLGMASGRSFSAEDRLVAAKLAQQAAVAADNQRLLESERERAVLHIELEQTRGRLATHLSNLGQILDSNDAERREIARQLHEGAAQAIAGVLLGLQVLERDLDRDLTHSQLEEVRSIARDTLADVRQLAVSVRPPSLDQLGLCAALEGMAERERARSSQQILLSCEECPRDLPAAVHTRLPGRGGRHPGPRGAAPGGGGRRPRLAEDHARWSGRGPQRPRGNGAAGHRPRSPGADRRLAADENPGPGNGPPAGRDSSCRAVMHLTRAPLAMRSAGGSTRVPGAVGGHPRIPARTVRTRSGR